MEPVFQLSAYVLIFWLYGLLSNYLELHRVIPEGDERPIPHTWVDFTVSFGACWPLSRPARARCRSDKWSRTIIRYYHLIA